MVSIDTNLLVYAQNSDSTQPEAARAFLTRCRGREIVICELVLVELYLVLRSVAIVSRPLGATEAAAVCTRYRENPRWRLVECAPVMGTVWQRAGEAGFARRKIIDTRLALTLSTTALPSSLRRIRDTSTASDSRACGIPWRLSKIRARASPRT